QERREQGGETRRRGTRKDGDTGARRHGGQRRQTRRTGPRRHGGTEGSRDGRGHGDTEARRTDTTDGATETRRADATDGVTETRRHGGTATHGPDHDQVRTSGGALQDIAVIPITTVSIADGWTSISTLPPSTRSGAMSRSRKSTRDASRAGCLVESRTRA